MDQNSWDNKIIEVMENKTVLRTVEEKMKEFLMAKFYDSDLLFLELSFCILTANTSAELGLKCVNRLKETNFESMEGIRSTLKSCKYRFPNTRSKFIYENYKKRYLLNFLRDIDDPEIRRDFIFENFIGIGYKEASHFLRNIGYFEYAILDKHILKFLESYFKKNFSNKSKKSYLEAEGYFRKLSQKYNTDPGIMDLFIWYIMTGKILK